MRTLHHPSFLLHPSSFFKQNLVNRMGISLFLDWISPLPLLEFSAVHRTVCNSRHLHRLFEMRSVADSCLLHILCSQSHKIQHNQYLKQRKDWRKNRSTSGLHHIPWRPTHICHIHSSNRRSFSNSDYGHSIAVLKKCPWLIHNWSQQLCPK